MAAESAAHHHANSYKAQSPRDHPAMVGIWNLAPFPPEMRTKQIRSFGGGMHRVQLGANELAVFQRAASGPRSHACSHVSTLLLYPTERSVHCSALNLLPAMGPWANQWWPVDELRTLSEPPEAESPSSGLFLAVSNMPPSRSPRRGSPAASFPLSFAGEGEDSSHSYSEAMQVSATFPHVKKGHRKETTKGTSREINGQRVAPVETVRTVLGLSLISVRYAGS